MSNAEEKMMSRDSRNVATVDAISERLAEVTRLAEKLDETLDEASARIRTKKNRKKFTEDGICDENRQKIGSDGNEREIDDDGSCTEDYVTATECTTTPIARSRSESFAMMSEMDDGLATDFCNARQEAVEEFRAKRKDTNTHFTTGTSGGKIDKDTSGYLEMAEYKDHCKDGPDFEKTSATSIIERVEEKSGKIVKEVTETTTLRVSHDTRFGVASYKLTSNTLREAHDHIDVKGILDAKGFGVKTNGYENGHKDDFSKYNREELSHSEINASKNKLENCPHEKFTKMVRESSQRETKISPFVNGANENKLLAIEHQMQRNDASCIEKTPERNKKLYESYDEIEDLELLKKMKTVSSS